MSNDVWRWADPDGQQRRVRLDELRAALANGNIAPNTPVWRAGWPNWLSAHEVPELTSAAHGSANGVVLNIPPPPLAMIAMQQDYEKKSESMAPASPSQLPTGPEIEPPPPPRWVPIASKMPSIHPASSQQNIATQVGGSPASGTFQPPSISRFVPSIPTALGLPAPQFPAAAPSAPAVLESADLIEELSDSSLLESGSQPNIMSGARLTPHQEPPRQSAPSHPDPLFLHDPPMRGPSVLEGLIADIKGLKAGQSPKNKPALVVAGVLSLVVMIGLFAVVVGLASSSPKTKTVASASPSASEMAPPTPVTTTSAAPTTTTSNGPTPVTAPPTTAPMKSVVLGDCTVTGEPKTIAPRALSGAAIEAQAVNDGLAFGFAATPREAVATTLDATSFTPTATIRTRLPGDVRRVTPIVNRGKLAVLADYDRKGDRLAVRRSVATSPLLDVGVADGALVWAPHGRDAFAKLFALDGDSPVEALRAIPLASKSGIAVTFRRDNAIRIGIANGESTLEADGELSKIEGLGQGPGTLGSPSIASSGDRVVVAWADRANTDNDWSVRWTTVKPHTTQHDATSLAVPIGGLGANAMSPAVASLGGGRFLLAWTEGAVSNHQVRALTFAADGAPTSQPLTISANGDNAGQPAIALNDDGKGVVAFLSAKPKGGLELHVTPISCPRQP